MSRRLISTLTVLAMLLHSILGCCAHHAHAEECQAAHALCNHSEHESTQSDSEVESDEDGKHKGCHHQHDESDADTESSSAVGTTVFCCSHENGPCPQHQCDDSQCRFDKTSVTESPRPNDADAAPCILLAIADLGLGRSLSEAQCLAAIESPLDRWCADHCAASVTQVWRL